MKLAFTKLDLFVSVENVLKFLKSLIRMRISISLDIKTKTSIFLTHLFK